MASRGLFHKLQLPSAAVSLSTYCFTFFDLKSDPKIEFTGATIAVAGGGWPSSPKMMIEALINRYCRSLQVLSYMTGKLKETVGSFGVAVVIFIQASSENLCESGSFRSVSSARVFASRGLALEDIRVPAVSDDMVLLKRLASESEVKSSSNYTRAALVASSLYFSDDAFFWIQEQLAEERRGKPDVKQTREQLEVTAAA